MVKFERLDTEKSRKAIQSLAKAQKNHGDYNTSAVMAALMEMFHGKCYICENKKHVTSFQIEHLNPHQGDTAQKYNWDNLFYHALIVITLKAIDISPFWTVLV